MIWYLVSFVIRKNVLKGSKDYVFSENMQLFNNGGIIWHDILGGFVSEAREN